MRQPIIEKPFLLVTIIVLVIIVYGSLYPFAFYQPSHGIGAVRTLLESWPAPLERGDFLANILLYAPLGFFGILAIRDWVGTLARVGFVLMLGMSISILMELTQYYDAGRVTSAIDVFSNVLGTLVGIIGALRFGSAFGKKFAKHQIHPTAPLMLLTVWATFRLFPFNPIISPHQVWNSLKPVLLHPSWAPYAFFRHIAMWTTVAVLISSAVGSRRSYFRFAAFALFLLFAKLFLVDATLSVAEIGGAAVAFCWAVVSRNSPRLQIITTCALLGCYVIMFRLEPFEFQARPRNFDWIPFFGFMHGSIVVNMLSFLEKCFLYGSLIWLPVELGIQLRWAALVVASLLFVTSWVEVFLPGRSAEITDTIMALLIGCIMALIGRTSSSQYHPDETQLP